MRAGLRLVEQPAADTPADSLPVDTQPDESAARSVAVPSYVELHCHSNLSFLDGTSDPVALVTRAAELGLPALALTDNHGLYGIVRFAAEAKARADRGDASPRPIIGAELLLEGGERLVLLVCDVAGYRNLCWLLDRAHRSHLAPDDVRVLGTPLAPPAPLSHELRRKQERGEPPIRLPSPACGRGAGGEGATSARGGEGTPDPHITLDNLRGRTAGLIALARPAQALHAHLAALCNLFGTDSLFVEIQRHLVPGEEPHNAALRRTALALGLRCVATNGVHYATKDRALLHDVVTSIRQRVPLEQAAQPTADRPPLLFPNDERCLKGPAEMARLFRAHPEELAATVEIAARCTFELTDLHYEFPRPDAIPEGQTVYDVLVEAVWEGARTYYGSITAKLQDRIVHELSIVKLLDLPGYLLVFKDVVDFCHRQRILVSIRGSAPASVLLYCLGLCPIDPLEHGLLFERFASPERGEYPDIDLDIAHEDREQVIQYVYEKYGRERVSMVCEVNTYRARSAIRDVAFALGLPQHQIDALAKTVDLYDRRSLDSLLESGGGGLPVDPRMAKLLVTLCEQLVGAPRHLSIHVGGMIISARPLHEVVHNQPARMPGRTIIPWDKDDIAILGEEFKVNLIKMDLLGLGMLKVVARVFEALEARGEPRLSLHGFRYDERVYDGICKGDTIGLFQIESRAQVSFLPRLQPRNLHDVAISVGAIRPGPGATGAGSRIARRRAGLEPVSYPHPDLEDVLKQTLGVLLWQEQVMQLAAIMGGYTLGESEQLRRAMTHKRSYEAMELLCEELVQRMLARGHSQLLAEEVRQMVIGFAGYGFPRAHAYPFAHLALVSATLKLRYPAEYYAALLNSQPMGFYAPHTLVWDAHRHGVRVLPVDINASAWDCTLEDATPLTPPANATALTPPAPLSRKRERGEQSDGATNRTHATGLAVGARRIVPTQPVPSTIPTPPPIPLPSPTCGRGVGGEGCRVGRRGEGRPVGGEGHRALRLGLTMVRGLGRHARDVLERERARGPYRSLADFVRRTGLDRDAVERLAEVGAFLRFDERRAAIWQAGELAGLSSPNHLPGLADQLAEAADLPAMDAWESTRADYSGLGLSVDRHLVSFYRPRLRLYNVRTAASLETARTGRVRIAGIVICRQRPETANDFMFMTLEDETGLVNVIVQPQVYHALTNALRGEPLLLIEGILQREGGVIDIIARRAWPFSVLDGTGTDASTVSGADPAARAVPSHDFH